MLVITGHPNLLFTTVVIISELILEPDISMIMQISCWASDW